MTTEHRLDCTAIQPETNSVSCLKGGEWGLALVSRSYPMCIGSGSILNVRGTKMYDNPNSAAYAHAGEGRGLGINLGGEDL